MKYLKSINELFDDVDIKSKMEIPYLRGDIDFKKLVSDKSLMKDGDTLLSKLSMNCPYVAHLFFRRISNNLIDIGFNKELSYGQGNDVQMYFVIEIMEHATTKSYICNVYAKCIGNGKVLYNESIHKPIMPYDVLVRCMNNEVLNLLIDFNKFTDRTFNFRGFPYMDRSYMKGQNLGQN